MACRRVRPSPRNSRQSNRTDSAIGIGDVNQERREQSLLRRPAGNRAVTAMNATSHHSHGVFPAK